MVERPTRHPQRSGTRSTLLPALGGALSAGSAGVLILLIGRLFDAALEHETLSYTVILGIVLTIVVGGIAEAVHRTRQITATSQHEAPLRHALVTALLRRGPATIRRGRAGDFVSLATDGVERVARYTGGFTHDLAAASANPIVILALIALFIDPVAALLLMVGVILGVWVIKWFSDTHRDVGSKSRKARGKVATAYLDAIQGLETLALLRATTRIGVQLADMGEQQRQATMRLLARNQQLLLVIDLVVSTVLSIGAFLLAGWGLADGHMSLGQAGALIAMTIIMIEPLEMVGSFFYIAMAGRAINRRIGGVIAQATQSPRIPHTAEVADATAAPAIETDNVGYAYTAGRNRDLAPVTLTIKAGEHVAIKGRSGAGKSTLLALIDGDLSLQSGTLTIGDRTFTAEDDTPVDRRHRCAVVAQDSWLFTGTVRDNLRMGAPHASEEQMWDALRRAHVDADIRALPQELDTEVGERGGMLSGGQVQRLALARAFLSGRSILILDEPTSHIDKTSELHIMRAIEETGRELTVIMATHRDSSTAGFDRVIDLGGSDETQ
ncbi:MAG: ATP-binding cassette domain-containing protein [Actinomycetaceae bacterium]|nr:ATP-binding cassette domain-containing protein [Actinomycetaceae bacterium]